MSERKKPRLALIGLIAVALIGSAIFYFSKTDDSNASEALDKAKSSQKLQSLAELDGKAPSRRKLDVQTWNTAEGAKVLFVAAPELPMFDLRLIFAAGSSQDGNAPGLAMLTNAMLNEGVAGKDVSISEEKNSSLISQAVVPIAMPLTAGAGTISTVTPRSVTTKGPGCRPRPSSNASSCGLTWCSTTSIKDCWASAGP